MIKGFCLGRFDLLHPGHLDLFQLAKNNCDYLIVGVIDKPFSGFKLKKSIFNIRERVQIVESIKYIDQVITFLSQQQVEQFLEENKLDKFFTGEEYIDNQPLSRFFEEGNIFYVKMAGFSSSKLKRKLVIC